MVRLLAALIALVALVCVGAPFGGTVQHAAKARGRGQAADPSDDGDDSSNDDKEEQEFENVKMAREDAYQELNAESGVGEMETLQG